jgi:hypothetical protein
MDYLLFTPFRYTRQNSFVSRFRRANAPDGVFYAAASPETAIAEMAFYRLLFYAESPDTPMPTNPAEYTAFAVQLRTQRGVDLTRAPMNGYAQLWMDPKDYSHCHKLADVSREEGIEIIGYTSLRDACHRLNYAVLTPRAFAQLKPITRQSWHMNIREDGVLAKCESPKIGLSFPISEFDIESRLKASERKAA